MSNKDMSDNHLFWRFGHFRN